MLSLIEAFYERMGEGGRAVGVGVGAGGLNVYLNRSRFFLGVNLDVRIHVETRRLVNKMKCHSKATPDVKQVS